MDETGAKITALDALTDGASDDLLAIVDVSDNDVGAGAMSVDGTDKKMTLANLLSWIKLDNTVTYSSVDDPTGVVTISGNLTSYFSNGMRIKFDNGGNTIYGIITGVSYSDPNTILTFLHEINPSTSQALHLMADSAITNFNYSPMTAPQGFPLDPSKWRIYVVGTNTAKENPVKDTVYNVFGSISVPVGSWNLSYNVTPYVQKSAIALLGYKGNYSTANNTLPSPDTESIFSDVANSTLLINTHTGTTPVKVSSKTTYYLNIAATYDNTTLLTGWTSPILIATCAYL